MVIRMEAVHYSLKSNQTQASQAQASQALAEEVQSAFYMQPDLLKATKC